MIKMNGLRVALVFCVLSWLAVACSFVPLGPSPTPWSTPTFGEVISGFASTDADERASAANWAGSYGDHPDKALLVPYLVEALSDAEYGGGDTSVRTFAAQSIRRLGIYDERAIEVLISWLDEGGCTGEALIQGIQALEAFAPYASGATPGLIRTMMNPPPAHRLNVQQAAVQALGTIGDPVAIPYFLLVFLSDGEQSQVRKGAAIELAKHGTMAVCSVPYVVLLLDSSEADVRVSAAIVISQATGNSFPDSERDNWGIECITGGGHSRGPWQFERGASGEYLIVVAAREWWEETGQYEEWPQCDGGLDGERVLPALD